MTVGLLKANRVKLKGKALKELNDAIHQRDLDCCIVCGSWVDRGEKFHHEPPAALKSDEMEKGVTLCYQCHHERHHGKNAAEIKAKCEEYLERLYGGR